MKKDKMRIVFNPPPEDARCECCQRHVSELEPFGDGFFAGAKLVKGFRSDEFNCIAASWECRDCIVLSDEEYWRMRMRSDGII